MTHSPRLARFYRAFLFLVVFALPATGFTQQVKAGRVTLDEGFSLEVPAGWTTVQAGREVLLTLHPPSQNDVQIEIRRAVLKSSDFAPMFSDSFHTSLRYSGFKFVSRSAQLHVPDIAGATTEYQGLASQGVYHLVVVELVHKNSVWLVCGFFDERRKDSYMRTFNRLLAGISLGDVETQTASPRKGEEEVE